MSTIPFNYKQYLDDVTKMRQRGHIDSGEQKASPHSAGSRGLAQTDNFTKSPNQIMKDNQDILDAQDERIIDIFHIQTVDQYPPLNN